jgi:hypothetical protein
VIDGPSLSATLLAAGGDAGIEGVAALDGAIEWARDGRPFALLDATGTRATFRLDPVLAAAARRTPDTDASSRGPEWVEFRPATLDGHAVDRAVAWFAAAARRAE